MQETLNDIKRDIYSVTRLNREVRAVLEGSFPPIWIQGEISNLARPGSGHLYFSLKDSASQVRCAMFRGRNQHIRFSPENGQEVLARATISLYEGRGEFQLIIDQIEPAGEGALQRAFEALKQRLHKEGLFEQSLKQQLPAFPHRIGVITSPTGAAIRDILHVLDRRYPLAGVIIYPVRVQGEGSAGEIVQALSTAALRNEVDVIILARGGGSLEDLWSFNDEQVARAVHACTIPVITGVGHEIDFTIVDFVADQRAPTPSAAAELAVPHRQDLLALTRTFTNKLITSMRHFLKARTTHLNHLKKRLPHPARTLQGISQRVDELGIRNLRLIRTIVAAKHAMLTRHNARLRGQNPMNNVRMYRDRHQYLRTQLVHSMKSVLQKTSAIVDQQARALKAVSPLATLERGYAIVTLNDRIIRNAEDVKPEDMIISRVATGNIQSRVTKVEKD